MPAVQTTYNAQHARWIEGMVLDMEPSVVVSRVVEGAAGIGFGKVAVQGTADNQAKASAASLPFTGIAVLDETQPNAKYDQYSTGAFMKKGLIVAQASVAVAIGDPVYFVPATGVLTNVSTSNTLIAGAQWDTSTSGAGLAALRLG